MSLDWIVKKISFRNFMDNCKTTYVLDTRIYQAIITVLCANCIMFIWKNVLTDRKFISKISGTCFHKVCHLFLKHTQIKQI